MKKYLLAILLFSTISGIAQKLKGFPVTVVRYYDNDTIKLRSSLLVGYKETKISSFTNFS